LSADQHPFVREQARGGDDHVFQELLSGQETSKSYIAFALPEAKKQQGPPQHRDRNRNSVLAWATERELGGRGAVPRRSDLH
jgi:hypothetical protein